MAFIIDDLLLSIDAGSWAFVAVACLIVIFFIETPEAFLGFVDFPVHEYLAPAAGLIFCVIAATYLLPAVVSMGFAGVLFFVAIIAIGAQAALNVTLEEGIAAGLVAVIIASPVFGF